MLLLLSRDVRAGMREQANEIVQRAISAMQKEQREQAKGKNKV